MDSLFFCLGMMHEYIGRSAIPNGDCIEHFFVDEGQNAMFFEDRLIRALKENFMGVNFSKKYYEACKGSNKYFVDFLSEDIVDWFESFFYMHPVEGMALVNPDGSNTPIPGILFIDQNKIVTPTQKLSYLRGSFKREGFTYCQDQDDEFWGGFQFANSYNKFRTVAKLLDDLGFDIEITENAFGPPHQEKQSIPAVNIIKIRASQDFMTLYNKFCSME